MIKLNKYIFLFDFYDFSDYFTVFIRFSQRRDRRDRGPSRFGVDTTRVTIKLRTNISTYKSKQICQFLPVMPLFSVSLM